MDKERSTACVLDASSYVGFWVLKRLLDKGYSVNAALQNQAGEISELKKKIWEMERVEERLNVFVVDVLDYQSILVALKGCNVVFCCLDSRDGYDEKTADWEVRGAINVAEGCAQTASVEKMVFSSSITAAVWKEENLGSQKDVDERSWSDQDFCRKNKLWYALAKTMSEKAAWGLAIDRMLNMVSINAGLVIGPGATQHNPRPTISYLRGAAQMYENGVLAFVDVGFLAEVHIRAYEEPSTCGRYFCFNQVVNTEESTLELAKSLTPLLSLPPRYEMHGNEVHVERLTAKKMNKLVEAGTPC